MKYEYSVIWIKGAMLPADVDKTLNELGEHGWKLVAVTETCASDGDSTGSTAYLMREKAPL